MLASEMNVFSRLAKPRRLEQKADRDIHEGKHRSVSQRNANGVCIFHLTTIVLIVLIRQVQGFQLPGSPLWHIEKGGDAIFVI